MIQFKNISYIYHKESSFALDDISLNIKEGEKIAIIGDNGSGKSTLAKMLIGLIKPRSGSLIVDDFELNEKNLLAIRSKIGMVFQNPNFQFIGSSVEEDLAWGLQNKNMPRNQMISEIENISKEFNITNKLKFGPEALSGGQKQKVAIASILILKPKYLVLDEITSMLDSKNSKELWETIENLYKQKNTTIISITHNMDEAALADRIIVMKNGKIIADDKPKIIFGGVGLNSDFITPSFEMDLSTRIFGVKNSTTNFYELIDRLEARWK